MDKKLMRSEENEQFLGVAAGLAKYFDLDVTIVRLLFVVFTLMGGPGILAYIILALIMPVEDSMISEQINIEKGPMAA
ncbi:MAG: PspC domain-containing protein [Anaerolineae bacterium]